MTIFCPSIFCLLSLACSYLINASSCCLLQRAPQQCHLITSLSLLNWTIQPKLTVTWSLSACTASSPGPSLLVLWPKKGLASCTNLNVLCSGSLCPSCMYPVTLMVCHPNAASRASLAVPSLWRFPNILWKMWILLALPSYCTCTLNYFNCMVF